jgi:hypothetical protein
LVEARCPVCGRIYEIAGSGNPRAVEGHFLKHKDNCQLPAEDEFVRVGTTVAITIGINDNRQGFPLFTVQYPSGRSRDFQASEVNRFEDQEEGRRRFYD